MEYNGVLVVISFIRQAAPLGGSNASAPRRHPMKSAAARLVFRTGSGPAVFPAVGRSLKKT